MAPSYDENTVPKQTNTRYTACLFSCNLAVGSLPAYVGGPGVVVSGHVVGFRIGENTNRSTKPNRNETKRKTSQNVTKTVCRDRIR